MEFSRNIKSLMFQRPEAPVIIVLDLLTKFLLSPDSSKFKSSLLLTLSRKIKFVRELKTLSWTTIRNKVHYSPLWSKFHNSCCLEKQLKSSPSFGQEASLFIEMTLIFGEVWAVKMTQIFKDHVIKKLNFLLSNM